MSRLEVKVIEGNIVRDGLFLWAECPVHGRERPAIVDTVPAVRIVSSWGPQRYEAPRVEVARLGPFGDLLETSEIRAHCGTPSPLYTLKRRKSGSGEGSRCGGACLRGGRSCDCHCMGLCHGTGSCHCT